MKNFMMLVAVMAMLGSNAAYAQSQGSNAGKGSAASASAGTNGGMAWLVGLGTLAVLGTVVGVTVASAADSPSSFSH